MHLEEGTGNKRREKEIQLLRPRNFHYYAVDEMNQTDLPLCLTYVVHALSVEGALVDLKRIRKARKR